MGIFTSIFLSLYDISNGETSQSGLEEDSILANKRNGASLYTISLLNIVLHGENEKSFFLQKKYFL